jgi:hypothetical protein
MEPLGVAGYVMVAAAAVLAVILGALGGAIAWALKRSLLWVALLVAGGYFAAEVLLGSSSVAPAAVIGIPPLILTLLTSWLTARYLQVRASFRRIPATLVGLGSALLLGFLWGFLFRLGLWAPVSVALAADACLIVLFYRSRKVIAQ